MAALKKASEILDILGGESIVRNYLRGLEDGSETALDAKRAMLSAIEELQSNEVPDRMAEISPNLYATACLLRCGQDTDSDYGNADAIERRYNGIVLKLRHDPRGKEENEVSVNA